MEGRHKGQRKKKGGNFETPQENPKMLGPILYQAQKILKPHLFPLGHYNDLKEW
jgi:hypothetical protein